MVRTKHPQHNDNVILHDLHQLGALHARCIHRAGTQCAPVLASLADSVQLRVLFCVRRELGVTRRKLLRDSRYQRIIGVRLLEQLDHTQNDSLADHILDAVLVDGFHSPGFRIPKHIAGQQVHTYTPTRLHSGGKCGS